MIPPVLVALACGSAAAAASAPIFAAAARRFGVDDAPGPRKIHASPVPLLGGAAVLVGTLAGVAAAAASSSSAAAAAAAVEGFARPESRLALAAGALAVFVTGLADDLAKGRLSPWIRLAAEAIAAAIVVGGGGCRAGLVPEIPLADAILTGAFLVLCANAMNLSDNMNGLAPGIAATAAGALAVVTGRFDPAHGAVLAAIAGAALGFLPFNWPRARLFLGDAGALALGFVIPAAALSAGGAPGGASPHLAAAVAVALALPLADTLFVALSRLRRGASVFSGDRRHVSHRLAALGLGRAGAPAALVAFSAGLGALAIAVASGSRSALAAALLATGALLAVASRSPRGLDDEGPGR